MKKLLFPVLFIVMAISAIAQTTGEDPKVKKLVSEGADLHDKGQYKEAIKKFDEALAIDDQSTMAMYEKANTLFALKKMDDAVELCKDIIKIDKTNLREAYILYGTILDVAGDPEGAIKVYKKGIKKLPSYYLLYFNLGLTQYNQGQYDDAEETLTKGIRNNPNHPTSHMLLGYVQIKKNSNRIKSMLPFLYFLQLEGDTKRAVEVYNTMSKLMNQGAKKTGENQITISMNMNGDKDEFGTVDMIMSLHTALGIGELDSGKSEIEVFAGRNKSLFSALKEQYEKKDGKKKRDQDFFWNFYVDYFSKMNDADQTETFSYIISIPKNDEDVYAWLKDNKQKIESFALWKDENTHGVEDTK